MNLRTLNFSYHFALVPLYDIKIVKTIKRTQSVHSLILLARWGPVRPGGKHYTGPRGDSRRPSRALLTHPSHLHQGFLTFFIQGHLNKFLKLGNSLLISRIILYLIYSYDIKVVKMVKIDFTPQSRTLGG